MTIEQIIKKQVGQLTIDKAMNSPMIIGFPDCTKFVDVIFNDVTGALTLVYISPYNQTYSPFEIIITNNWTDIDDNFVYVGCYSYNDSIITYFVFIRPAIEFYSILYNKPITGHKLWKFTKRETEMVE